MSNATAPTWYVEVESGADKRFVSIPSDQVTPMEGLRLVGEHNGVRFVGDDVDLFVEEGKRAKLGEKTVFCKGTASQLSSQESHEFLEKLKENYVPILDATHLELHRFYGDYHVSTQFFPKGDIEDVLTEENGRYKIVAGTQVKDWAGDRPAQFASRDGSTMVLVPVRLEALDLASEAFSIKNILAMLGLFAIFVGWSLFLFFTTEITEEKEEIKIEAIPKRFVKIRKIPDSGYKFVSPKKFGDMGGQGAKRVGKEGKRGKLSAADKAARAKRIQARRAKAAKTAGVLSVLGGDNGIFAAKPSQGSGLSDMKSTLGGISGSKYGDQRGVGGYGLKGVGSGGGGNAIAGVGVGKTGLGAGAAGSGKGFIEGGGTGEISLPPIEDTEMVGSLDKDLIRAIIAKYLPQIRACYEKGLSSNDSLAGKVRTQFVIGATGSMQSVAIQRSTLGDAGVHNCMKTVMMKWQFPKPKGNGIVRVTYPFIFKPTG